MILPRRHDRYVLKAFWSSFGAVLLFFSIIVIVLHLSDRLSRVVRYWDGIRAQGYEPLAVLAEYYATLLPFVWMQIIPLAGVLSAAFALTRLTRHNELSPLVTSGVSTRRISLPILVSGLLLGLGLLGLQEGLVPRLSRRNMSLERLLNESEPGRITKVPHFDDPGGARLSVAAFRPFDLRLEGALLTFREAEGRLAELRSYPLLRWEAQRGWVAEQDGTTFVLRADGAPPLRARLPAADPVPLEADLSLFEVSALKEGALALSAGETRELLGADPANPRLKLQYHQVFARCFTPVILLLLGLPFCLVLGRRSAIPGTVAVLTAGAVYYATQFLTTSLAAGGAFNPTFLAWFPVATYGSVGLGLWLTMDS